MKIATYNVNGVNGRLLVLLRWLAETKPDVACLQELKAPQEKFPEAAIQAVRLIDGREHFELLGYCAALLIDCSNQK
jgi:exonuclease III